MVLETYTFVEAKLLTGFYGILKKGKADLLDKNSRKCYRFFLDYSTKSKAITSDIFYFSK